MKDQDYELLSQFIDGELPAEASQELRGRLLAEPELRATYERLRKLDGRIRETFNAPGTDTVPSRVTSLLERRKNSADRKHAGWGFAVAASTGSAHYTTSSFLIRSSSPRINSSPGSPQHGQVSYRRSTVHS